MIYVWITLILTSCKNSHSGIIFWGGQNVFQDCGSVSCKGTFTAEKTVSPKHLFFTSVDPALGHYILLCPLICLFSHSASPTVYLCLPSCSLPVSFPAWSFLCGLFRPLHLSGRERSFVFFFPLGFCFIRTYRNGQFPGGKELPTFPILWSWS